MDRWLVDLDKSSFCTMFALTPAESPPSMMNGWAVQNEDSSEARNKAIAAISPGRPIRPRACIVPAS